MSSPRRLLVVSPYLPHSAIGHGGGISTYHFVRELAREREVALICFRRRGEDGLERELEDAGVRVECVPFRSDRDRGLARLALMADRALVALAARQSGRPPFVQKYVRPEFERRLLALVGEFEPDVVQVEYVAMSPYLETLRAARADRRPYLVLNTHEAGSLPRRRRLEASRDASERSRAATELRIWERQERAAADAADLVQCVTPGDRDVLASLGSEEAKLWVQPFGIDAEGLADSSITEPSSPHALFVGSFAHGPNREAAELLVERIWPRIVATLPNATLDIVGREPTAKLWAAAARDERIQIHGFVESLDESFASAALFVAPLFSGGGIKIKILEALGRGALVLTTPIGIEGIDMRPGEHLLVADDPDSFAEAAITALGELAAHGRMRQNARAAIRERYGWSRVVRDLIAKLETELKKDGA